MMRELKSKAVLLSIALSFTWSCKSSSSWEADGNLSAEEIGLKPWNKIASAEFEIADPPAKGSAQDKADYQKLLTLQRNRKQTDCDLAKTQRFPTFEVFFNPDTELLTKDEFENVRPMLVRISKFSQRVAGYFKDKFVRERPYNADKRITPCVRKPEGARSYPSSHAAVAATGGCVLARVYPDYAKDFVAYAAYLGDLRAIVGIHHPSDVEAGRKLGIEICERLFTEATFNDDMHELLPVVN